MKSNPKETTTSREQSNLSTSTLNQIANGYPGPTDPPAAFLSEFTLDSTNEFDVFLLDATPSVMDAVASDISRYLRVLIPIGNQHSSLFGSVPVRDRKR